MELERALNYFNIETIDRVVNTSTESLFYSNIGDDGRQFAIRIEVIPDKLIMQFHDKQEDKLLAIHEIEQTDNITMRADVENTLTNWYKAAMGSVGDTIQYTETGDNMEDFAPVLSAANLERLVQVATKLDEKGKEKLASKIDNLIFKKAQFEENIDVDGIQIYELVGLHPNEGQSFFETSQMTTIAEHKNADYMTEYSPSSLDEGLKEVIEYMTLSGAEPLNEEDGLALDGFKNAVAGKQGSFFIYSLEYDMSLVFIEGVSQDELDEYLQSQIPGINKTDM